MASYHVHVKTVRRAEGRSATAAAAYRAGARVVCERIGTVHDYGRKSGVASTQIIAPEGAPAWAHNREALWNAAEAAEKRKDGVTAREWEIALPADLDAEARRALAEGFAAALVTRYGVAADVAIHEPHREGDARNHHAHILTTTRRLETDGLGEKTRVLDSPKTSGPEVEAMRKLWAQMQNEALKAAGSEERVDHRTLAAQRAERTTEAGAARGVEMEEMAQALEASAEGLSRPPEPHMGRAANALERKARKAAAERGEEAEPVTALGAEVTRLRGRREGLRRAEAETAQAAEGWRAAEEARASKPEPEGEREAQAERKAAQARRSAEREVLRRAHKAEREAIALQDWSGRTEVRAALRSLTAARQAGEWAALWERHCAERRQERAASRTAAGVPAPFVLAEWIPSRKEPAPPQDIRDYVGEAEGHRVHYRRKDAPEEDAAFIDCGTTIEIHERGAEREAAVLAALQLAQKKWGMVEVKQGDAAFRSLCVKLALEHGFLLANEDLYQRVSAGRDARERLRDAQAFEASAAQSQDAAEKARLLESAAWERRQARVWTNHYEELAAADRRKEEAQAEAERVAAQTAAQEREKARAARHGRSTEAEIRGILEAAAAPPERVRLGSLLAAIAREAGGLTDDEAKRFDAQRDRTPAAPMSLE